jgi:hypothetical protein
MILEPYDIEIINRRKCKEYKLSRKLRTSDIHNIEGMKWTRIYFEENWWHSTRDDERRPNTDYKVGNITESSKYIFLESKNGRYYA